MPFCIKCHKEIKDNWEICPHCGAPNVLSKSEAIEEKKSGKEQFSFQTIDGSEQGGYGFDLSKLPKDFEIENRYRIEKKLGRGGFGTVYKAWDKNFNRYKALKVIDNIFYDDKRVISDLTHEATLTIS